MSPYGSRKNRLLENQNIRYVHRWIFYISLSLTGLQMNKHFNLYRYSKAAVPLSVLALVGAMMESLPWLHCSTDLPDGTWEPPALNLWPTQCCCAVSWTDKTTACLTCMWPEYGLMTAEHYEIQKNLTASCRKGFTILTVVTHTFKTVRFSIQRWFK